MIKGKHTRIGGGAKFWSGNTAMVGGLISKPVIINQQNFVSSPSMPSWLTLTRLSTATRFDNTGTLVDVAADTARFDYAYNGASWANQGLLLEKAATNLFAYSNNWPDTSAISVVNMVVSGGYVLSTSATDTQRAYSSNSISVTASNPTTTTALVSKLNNLGTKINLNSADSSSDAGVVSIGFAPNTSNIKQEYFSDNKVKASYTRSADYSGNIYGVYKYAANRRSDIRLEFMQVEVGSYPTSFIKTSGTAVTRAQDNLQLNVSKYTGSIKLTYKRQDTGATESTWIDLANATNPILTNSVAVGIWLQNIAVYNRTLTAQEKANA
ncbi:phage head spike fiber domain-containing protein [Acinetobacter soli]|uniref:phage head spike fiber domain-containing protein n=1 Tax=Acinetobacter soli TaxID=487316 RepID=UPI00124FBF00|nr:hypothetical protein [Acinetobacter soli]